jgi:hypothetical protein
MAAVTAALGIGASSGFATIVAVVPDVVLFQPADVRLNQTQSNVQIDGFDEKQCFKLGADLTTDQGLIAAGTVVSCHFFHLDPVNGAPVLEGKARFDDLILGVISDSGLLDDSDAPCQELDAAGNPLVIYPMPGVEANRGLDPNQVNDRYQIIQGGLAIKIRMDVPSFSDQVRVVTRCVCVASDPACGGI